MVEAGRLSESDVTLDGQYAFLDRVWAKEQRSSVYGKLLYDRVGMRIIFIKHVVSYLLYIYCLDCTGNLVVYAVLHNQNRTICSA